MHLHATDAGNGTAMLSWDAPVSGPAPALYRVYADGELAAIVQGTRHAVAVGRPTLYSVTAQDADGRQSAPAALVVGQLRLAPDWPFRAFGPARFSCPPTGLNVYTHYPFVAFAVYEECLPISPP
ncbi:MAG: hypothetical protein QOI63_1887 [Thermoplasmata archaeon]|nr:hypothetical protein [Thermoplasmata archaeon]